MSQPVYTPGGLVFGGRAVRAEQPRILENALEALGSGRGTVVFDLDSTLLNNKPRQSRIVREYGARVGDERLAACPDTAVVSWDLRDTMRILGFTREGAEAVYPGLKGYWRAHFFTDYCADDLPLAGAVAYVERVLSAGGKVLYVTGRHAGMGAGTIQSFRRGGFPVPDGARVDLWLKPDESEDDDAWKVRCHARLAVTGELAAAFDNEPTHVNAYKRAFPGASVVHLDTDHSGRRVDVLDSISSVSDFVLELE